MLILRPALVTGSPLTPNTSGGHTPPSMLTFTNLPTLSIKHKISGAGDRCSCPAAISYASVPGKRVLGAAGQSSTARGKAEEPGVGNVAASPATPAPLWISDLGRDKLPGLAGGCAGAARFTSETQAIPRQISVQTESVRHREKRTGESAGAARAGSCAEF